MLHVILIILAAAAIFGIGMAVGWNNSRSSLLTKIGNEEKNLTGDAAKAISNVKAKL